MLDALFALGMMLYKKPLLVNFEEVDNGQELRKIYWHHVSKKRGDLAISAPVDALTVKDGVNGLYRPG